MFGNLHRLSLCALVGAASSAAPDASAQEAPEPAQVMVVGVFHFEASGDPLNPTIEDLDSPERQAQIIEVVERLAAFEPTVVAIEAETDAAIVTERYGRYLAGATELGSGEREQIGFRLAEAAGLAAVHGVDSFEPLDIEGLLAWAGEHGQGMVAQQALGGYVMATRPWAKAVASGAPVGEALAAFNDPATDAAIHRGAMQLLRVGAPDDPAGANLLEDWHGRNLRIASNILRLAQPGERIVVLFGANHRTLLLDALEQADGVETVDAQGWLTGE